MSSPLVQALLAFLLIVIAIPVALVTLRRVRMFNPASRQVLRITGGISLGPRERIAVVEVGGRWLVVGVTAQSINLLTTLDAAPGELSPSRVGNLTGKLPGAAPSIVPGVAPSSASGVASGVASRVAPGIAPGIAPGADRSVAGASGPSVGDGAFARLLAATRRREAS